VLRGGYDSPIGPVLQNVFKIKNPASYFQALHPSEHAANETMVENTMQGIDIFFCVLFQVDAYNQNQYIQLIKKMQTIFSETYIL